MTKLLPLLIILPIVAAAYYLTATDPCQRPGWLSAVGDGDPTLICLDDAGAEGDAVAREASNGR